MSKLINNLNNKFVFVSNVEAVLLLRALQYIKLKVTTLLITGILNIATY